MSLESLIATYGYAAIGVGTFFEGETVLVLGGFAAHRGYLELPWVIVYAFLGSLAGDQLYYFIGRTKGKEVLERRPAFKAKAAKVLKWLERYQVGFMLGFRFLYGFRTIAPFLIGASNVPPARFLLFNMIGAIVWAGVIGSLGYAFGQVLELVIGDVKKYELYVFLSVALIAALMGAVRVFKRGDAE